VGVKNFSKIRKEKRPVVEIRESIQGEEESGFPSECRKEISNT